VTGLPVTGLPVSGLLALVADPPLTPSGPDAHHALRRELLRPGYHEDNLLLRLLSWLQRVLDDGLTSAREAPPLTTFAAMLVGLLVLGAVVWLLSRARRSRRIAAEPRPLLTEEVVSAQELRRRAEAAYAEGRYADALVDAYRACAVRQIERGRLDDLPGATPHEVAVALAGAFPTQAADVYRVAGLFDLVLYGGREPSREQAADVLGLDERLDTRLGVRR
jgi:hypothetical protein